MKTFKKVSQHLVSGIFLSLLIVFAIASCKSGKPEDNPNNKAALEEIRKEPKVVEAMMNDTDVLYVSVYDDGTRRDGYASYICQILKEHSSTISRVKVMKAGSTNDPNKDNAYGVLLGESFCK